MPPNLASGAAGTLLDRTATAAATRTIAIGMPNSSAAAAAAVLRRGSAEAKNRTKTPFSVPNYAEEGRFGGGQCRPRGVRRVWAEASISTLTGLLPPTPGAFAEYRIKCTGFIFGVILRKIAHILVKYTVTGSKRPRGRHQREACPARANSHSKNKIK